MYLVTTVQLLNINMIDVFMTENLKTAINFRDEAVNAMRNLFSEYTLDVVAPQEEVFGYTSVNWKTDHESSKTLLLIRLEEKTGITRSH